MFNYNEGVKRMSLYNLINGANPATFFILPMLGKHPDEYPRFRDCFAGRANNSDTEMDQFGIPLKKNNVTEKVITIYTRTGGGNRESYLEQNNEMQNMPEYLEDYDDDFDSTFAYWIFKVPEKWIPDFDLVINGKLNDTSAEYKNTLKTVYPKLADKFDSIFKDL
jgi:hypothetical protein